MKGYGLYYNLTAAQLLATVNKLPPIDYAEVELRAMAAGVRRRFEEGSANAAHVANRAHVSRRRQVNMAKESRQARERHGRPAGSGGKLARKAAAGKLGLRW